MAFIECRGLYHDYNAGMENEYRALDNVSLGVEKGEFVTILGTNGSGKQSILMPCCSPPRANAWWMALIPLMRQGCGISGAG